MSRFKNAFERVLPEDGREWSIPAIDDGKKPERLFIRAHPGRAVELVFGRVTSGSRQAYLLDGEGDPLLLDDAMIEWLLEVLPRALEVRNTDDELD